MSDTQTSQVERYFELMTASDIAGIVSLFADDGYVMSPFLGRMMAADFFPKLGGASTASLLTVHDILLGRNGDSAAARFRYDWTLADGSDLSFEGVDYFTFAPDGKFQSMLIYYDTHPLRLEVGDKYATAQPTS
ncbi:MAG: nuclear transport factor 2 family protein [Pikeienuella sp.]